MLIDAQRPHILRLLIGQVVRPLEVQIHVIAILMVVMIFHSVWILLDMLALLQLLVLRPEELLHRGLTLLEWRHLLVLLLLLLLHSSL